MNFLTLLWRKWLKVARVIGNFQSQVILAVFYIVLLLPLGLILRIIQDPLKIKDLGGRTRFEKWNHKKETLEEARKQY